jgi:hypothetical protein
MMQDFLFYLNLGWEHIISLDALDHQLFVLALLLFILTVTGKILILVTAFTIGHSITLALSILMFSGFLLIGLIFNSADHCFDFSG